MDQPRNVRIDGVELNWAKLAKPVQNPFNKDETLYELQIATTDAAKKSEIEGYGIKVREKDGKFVASLKRKTKKADGSDNGPVRVVNGDLTPMNNPETIGNGSVGNVILFQYPWSNMGRSGIGTSLTAVQVTKLEAYTPTSSGVEFEAVGGAPAAAPVEEGGVELF